MLYYENYKSLKLLSYSYLKNKIESIVKTYNAKRSDEIKPEIDLILIST